ncbi:MAG: 6,7-dimethyl-8-ribityllumazine synthase, partial [Candidatus Latescibacteria bacterium]|nr:6,7-dimethyl-8-ribityllumazine synthase [Candidatus Latescibacterota bacterium]
MVKIYEGELSAVGKRFGIVVSRFNELISNKLLDGALDCLKRHQAEEDYIEIAWVPGAFEIPLTAKKMAESGKYDAILCLGAVIRGSTPHFDYVAAEASKGIALAGMDTGVPVMFGVITTDTVEQAIDRAGIRV